MEIKIKPQPGKFKEIKGDVTQPYGAGLIIQIVNDIGAYGAGVSGAISKRWKKAEVEYRRWYQTGKDCKLGEVQFIYLDPDFELANMVAQSGIRSDVNPSPIRYNHLIDCLQKVARYAKNNGHKRIHAPKIGTGLAGGDWKMIETIIKENIVSEGLEIIIYSL